MAELFADQVDITDSGSNITITLNANNGNVSAGGSGKGGDLLLSDAAGNLRVQIDGQNGIIRLKNAAGTTLVQISANGDIALGGSGADGDLTLKSSAGHLRMRFDGESGDVRLGGSGADGDVRMYVSSATSSAGDTDATIHLDAGGGNIWAGGHGADGDLVLLPSGANNVNDLSQATIHLDAGGTQMLFKAAGQNRARILGADGNIWLGGNGSDGDLVMFPTGGDNSTLAQATVHLDAGGGNLWLGGNGTDGDVVLFPSGANNINDLSQATIQLDGQAGDIILKNADCAEDFDVAGGETIEPGSVVVLDEEGMIRESREPYNTGVAGVVSGAGDHRPGIIMDRNQTGAVRSPIALVGKVFCKVDASFGPIEVGSLLTSSSTPGHAMRVLDPARAFGAVLGKALRPLASGRGMIPILVALQ